MKLQRFSLLIAVAGALIFTAAFVPQANAFVVVVYNFEDSTVGGPPDFTTTGDVGTQAGPLTQMTTDYIVSDISSVTPGIPLNVAPGELDQNNLAIQLSHAKTNEGSCFQFTVNTFNLTQMSLSFAYNNNGNGFTTATFQYKVNGVDTTFHDISMSTLTTGGNFVATSATVPMAAENQASVTFQICFTGGTSNGNNIQTVIDNVRLDAAPEPATVASGLFSVCGLCWFQRRRLIRFVRLGRT